MAKISAAIAAYCGEKYILRQLESLFRQTVKIHEIIICDDSPSDTMYNIVSSIIGKAPCTVKIYRNEKTLGPAQNFAEAISYCTGDLIFLCDQDDVWKEDKVQKLAAVLENDPQADVVFCNSCVVNEDLTPLGYSTTDIVKFSAEKAAELNNGKGILHLLRTPMLYGHNIAMKRSFLPLLLPIPENLPSYDLFIAELCAGRGRVRCIYEDLTLHCRHGKNQSTQKKPGGIFRRLFAILSKKHHGKDTEIYDSFIHADAAYKRLKMLAENEFFSCPEENMFLLKKSVEYYRTRLALTAKPRFLRPIFLFTVKGYFTMGYGLRSIIRDLLF